MEKSLTLDEWRELAEKITDWRFIDRGPDIRGTLGDIIAYAFFRGIDFDDPNSYCHFNKILRRAYDSYFLLGSKSSSSREAREIYELIKKRAMINRKKEE